MSTRGWAWALGITAPAWAAVIAGLVILGEHR